MAKLPNNYRLFTLFAILFLLVETVILLPNQENTKQTFTPKAQATGSFFGFNIHSLSLLNGNDLADTLNQVNQCSGTNVIRFWGFAGGDHIGTVLANSPAGTQFIVTLSNYYGGYPPQPWPAPETNPTSWYSNDWKTNGFKDFVNSVTTKYRGNQKILMWEIMNEPNCTADSACSQAQHNFLNDVSTLIAQNDPGKLISPGTQAQNTGGERFDNGDFQAIVQLTNITAVSCHLYGDADFQLKAKPTVSKLFK